MTWQLLLTISVISYSLAILVQRILLKDKESDAVAYAVVFQLLTAALISIYVLGHGIKVGPLALLLPNLVLMAILYAVGNIFIFKALKLGEASEFTILFTTRVFWTILVAIIFLGERFSTSQFVGTFLIWASVVFKA